MTASRCAAGLAGFYAAAGVWLIAQDVPAAWTALCGVFALVLGITAWKWRRPRPNWRAEEKAALKGSMDLEGLLEATPRVEDKL